MHRFNSQFVAWSAATPLAAATGFALLLIMAFGQPNAGSLLAAAQLFASLSGIALACVAFATLALWQKGRLKEVSDGARVAFAGTGYAFITFGVIALFLALDDRSLATIAMQVLAFSVASGVAVLVIPERTVPRQYGLALFLGLSIAAFGTMLAWEFGLGAAWSVTKFGGFVVLVAFLAVTVAFARCALRLTVPRHSVDILA